jgi:SagB-type dehydrogenase family enzyme
MRLILLNCLLLALFLFSGCKGLKISPYTGSSLPITSPSSNIQMLKLPQPRLTSDISLEQSLLKRRSVRDFSEAPLNLEEVSQLLWAAQGITAESGGRTAPSAGALYPLEVYLVAGLVEGLAPGTYHYKPQGHELISISLVDAREKLSQAALGQGAAKNGAVSLVISAVYERTTQKYGDRGIRYALIEVGHAAQNICLQATALDLGAVTIGAFDDSRVKSLLAMPENESALYIIPVGHKR